MIDATRTLGVLLRRRVGMPMPEVTTSQEFGTPTCFMPRIPATTLQETLQVVASLQGLELHRALRRRAADALRSGGPDAKAIRATLLLLCDLSQQGWRIESARGALWVTAPRSEGLPGESLDEVKNRLRAPLLTARAAQLADPAVRAFLRRMETPRVVDGQRVSVLSLIDDGDSLAAELRATAALPDAEREAALANIVRPALHLATSDSACPYTGLSLLDIWRYFRHTWSLEYRPTPGRVLFLMIRNEARPLAPVMGIAALANALPQLRVRDLWIGWTPEAVTAHLAEHPGSWRELRDALLRTLDNARCQIRDDDLRKRIGKLRGRKLEEALLAISEAASARREADLRERQARLARGQEVLSLRFEPTDAKGDIDWKAASEAPLFVRKRAKTLADILFAERVLSEAPASAATVKEHLPREEFVRALSVALREVRKVGLASRLLEVNVCGAVAPYRDILAGKLMALSLASADVRAMYRQRYREQASDIASKMAGRSVVRAPEVCVLTTTSLFGVAASQYNRLRIEVEGSRGPVRLEWRELGKTEGYGTVHLSESTVEALRAVSVESRGGRNVNNVFGEGNSPRLRQVREGVEAIGLDSDAILRHSAPRIVYALELHEDARRALLLNRAPRARSPDFSAVAAAWNKRWLAMRVKNTDVLDRVAGQGVATVRAELAAPEPQLDLFVARVPSDTAPLQVGLDRRSVMPKVSKVELIQSLYRNLSSCADHLDAASVDLLHIETALDKSVRTRAIERQVVFVTGNPGDGKTFLLKKLEPELKAAKADVCLDANEEDDADLVKRIDSALRKKTGLVIAINEGILLDLLRVAADRTWADEIRSQLLRPFEYRRAELQKDARISVLDLNLRNNLAPEIVRAALNRVIELSAPCAGCPKERCDGYQNMRRLGEPVVADRLSALLGLVSRSGYHATMRDLFGFLSFALWGGRACADVKEEATSPETYAKNVFVGGVGPLFDAARWFDPAAHSSPLLDDELWRYSERKADWQLPANDVPENGDLDARRAAFARRKRRAYFEFRSGELILRDAGSSVDKALRDLLDPDRANPSKVVRLLNRFYDRDEERSEGLFLWVTHRYDARPTRFAAARWHVPTNDMEILIPKLRPDLADAFPAYQADHVILARKGDPPEMGLRIDRSLMEALVAAEQGLPSSFRSGEPGARIAAFYDRLAKRAAREEAGRLAEVRFVDIDTGANMRVSVDLKDRRYVRP